MIHAASSFSLCFFYVWPVLQFLHCSSFTCLQMFFQALFFRLLFLKLIFTQNSYYFNTLNSPYEPKVPILDCQHLLNFSFFCTCSCICFNFIVIVHCFTATLCSFFCLLHAFISSHLDDCTVLFTPPYTKTLLDKYRSQPRIILALMSLHWLTIK